MGFLGGEGTQSAGVVEVAMVEEMVVVLVEAELEVKREEKVVVVVVVVVEGRTLRTLVAASCECVSTPNELISCAKRDNNVNNT